MKDKEKALLLIAQGLCSPAEAARMCGVSRQAVTKWCASANIDPVAARTARLLQDWDAPRRTASLRTRS